jgi:diguanylate cyclase (GGDEF)-like protein
VRSTVFIVDDDITNIDILSQLLESEFELAFATSGSQALDLITRTLPDLVLLDVMMPDMDGYAVCRQLKAEPLTTNIPVIFITGLLDAESESHGLQIGAADYVTKPFRPDVVRARVRNNVELKRARDALVLLAASDGLTGLANRRSFDEVLERECQRLARSQAPLGLVMCDIDAFKLFNDRYGHVAGDDCLRRIATVLTSSMQRTADIATRYGGEEFAIILPNATGDGAMRVAERLQIGINALAIPHAHSPVASTVTASFGVISERCTRATDPLEVVRAADTCLYEAKSNGRNRIVARAGNAN